ncbi:MAG: ExeM/NucH family extracellular endonuclease [Betaproteobacteria bacterium]
MASLAVFGGESAIAAREGDVALTAIHAIQGRGARSPLAGRRVATQGAVTRVASNGFFLQEPVGDGAVDARASRGVFVFTDSAPRVEAGACVSLAARVVEFDVGAPGNAETAARTVTELHEASVLRMLAGPCAIEPVDLVLPLAPGDSLERLEGMLVTLRGPLTVQQNFFLGRFGQLSLAAGGRVSAPTDRVAPGAAARALARADARRAIVLDDGSAAQDPQPVPFVGDDGTVRAGDTVAQVTGVIDYGLAGANAAGHGAWKIHPVQPPVFARANPRLAAPAAVGGTLKVAAANVDNYFSTVNDGAHACAPRHVAADCRGARNVAEFERQRAKLVEALAAIGADVVALMEIENNGAVALRTLVDALNLRVGAGQWAAIADPREGTGGDAIKVALIYRPARVRPVGGARADRDPAHNRPPLAQAFATVAGDARVNIIASHFKSRRCEGAAGLDLDRQDGQGCFGHRRVKQAQALARFAREFARRSGVDDTLLVGDFNAYTREDAVRVLATHGFADQIARFDPHGYSYVFDGAAGRLDQVLANAALAPKVTGVTEWHINADEPALLGYASGARAPACSASPACAPACPACAPSSALPTPWRASDHDPVVIGLALGAPATPRQAERRQ